MAEDKDIPPGPLTENSDATDAAMRERIAEQSLQNASTTNEDTSLSSLHYGRHDSVDPAGSFDSDGATGADGTAGPENVISPLTNATETQDSGLVEFRSGTGSENGAAALEAAATDSGNRELAEPSQPLPNSANATENSIASGVPGGPAANTDTFFVSPDATGFAAADSQGNAGAQDTATSPEDQNEDAGETGAEPETSAETKITPDSDSAEVQSEESAAAQPAPDTSPATTPQAGDDTPQDTPATQTAPDIQEDPAPGPQLQSGPDDAEPSAPQSGAEPDTTAPPAPDAPAAPQDADNTPAGAQDTATSPEDQNEDAGEAGAETDTSAETEITPDSDSAEVQSEESAAAQPAPDTSPATTPQAGDDTPQDAPATQTAPDIQEDPAPGPQLQSGPDDTELSAPQSDAEPDTTAPPAPDAPAAPQDANNTPAGAQDTATSPEDQNEDAGEAGAEPDTSAETEASRVTSGFHARYFDMPKGSAKKQTVDWESEPAHEDLIESMDFSNNHQAIWTGATKSSVAFSLEGNVANDQAGTFTFHLDSGDGASLFVNGVEVIADGGKPGNRTRSAEVEMEEGISTIEVRYHGNFGQADLRLDWEGPGIDGIETMAAGDSMIVAENGIMPVEIDVSDLSSVSSATMSGLPADTVIVGGDESIVSDGGDVDLSGLDLSLLEIAPPSWYEGAIEAQVSVTGTGSDGEMVSDMSTFEIAVGNEAAAGAGQNNDGNDEIMVADTGESNDSNWVDVVETEQETEAGSEDVMSEPVEENGSMDTDHSQIDTYERQDW